MSFASYQPNFIHFETNQQTPPSIKSTDVHEIKNATVFVSDTFEETGVYDENGNLCSESILLRKTNELPKSIHKNIHGIDFIDETVIYLGCCYLMQHFGHFLVEGMARTYALLYKKYQNIKVVVAYENKIAMPGYVRMFLNALGVRDKDIIVIYKPTRFARVFVPVQAMNAGLYISPIMNRVFDTVALNLADKKCKTYDKIYLSRSAMNDGRTFGEKTVEKIFEKNGYKIIHPEKLALGQQIALARGAREMAGTAGSALHMALFMKPNGRVIQIKRNSDNTDNIDIQKIICDLRKLDLVWVFGSIEENPTPHYTQIPQIIGITKNMLDFFDDNGFRYNTNDIAPDLAEIKKYKRQLQKYKLHGIYRKISDIPVRLVSLVGITKHGRKIVREYLRKKLHV